MAARKKTSYQAGQRYFGSLDEARAYALTIRNAYKVPISRNGVHAGDVDVGLRRWMIYSKPKVAHNGNGYTVYRAVAKEYRLNTDGTTNGRTR